MSYTEFDLEGLRNRVTTHVEYDALGQPVTSRVLKVPLLPAGELAAERSQPVLPRRPIIPLSAIVD